MFLLLPTALVIFLVVSPVVSEPTSPNDPFRAIVLQVPKVPGPPICCLKPLTPLEPVDDEVLLSFEEWKTRQTTMQANSEAKAREETNRSSLRSNANSDNGSDPTSSLQDASPSSDPSKAEETAPELRVEVSPHFRVPLTDRFNYASLDCSARVHTSHRSAKSASSILSSKRDRYMLSPCNSKEKQFVAVELCDDIRIDTVQLANFEFFSGVFKDISVSVAKTYTTDVDGWTHVGSYKAKNVRGVQSFHPPTSLRDFYRYIRIDFETHYGNEYFCPVSLLRVYGLTHLEQWKWDIWETESRVKQEELQKDRKFTLSNGLPVDHIPTQTVQIPVSPNNSINDGPTDSSSMVSDMDPMAGHLKDDKFLSHNSISSSLLSVAVPESQTEPTATLSSMETALSATSYSNDPTSHIPDSPSTEVNAPSPSSNVNILSSVVNHSQAYSVPMTSPASHSPHQSSHDHAILNNTNTSTTVPSHSSPLPIFSSSVAVIQAAPSAAPPTRGVESIYSTIMNRLTAIESNHTLYTRYIDQQNSVIREVLKRLGEDVGRLEGISRAQTLMHQRTLDDWEMQRYQLEMEYHDLRSRIENLSEEVVLEKRLGIAQLCLLLAVLVFMGLTRGSRTEIEHGPFRFNSMSMKEWGKRHFSNDWTKGKKSIVAGGSSEERSRSRDFGKPAGPLSSKPHPSPQKPLDTHDENVNRKFTFPSRKPRKELEPLQLNSSTTGEYYPRSGTMTTSRSRATSLRSTPTGRRTQYTVQNNVVTPTRSLLRLPLQRSNSQGGPSLNYTNTWGVSNYNNNNNIPKSARKWGRTAHLHEVRSAVPHSVLFSGSTGGGQKSRKWGSSERPLGPRFDHDRAARPLSAREFDEYDSEDVFSSALRRPNTAGAQVPRRANNETTSSTAVDDEDPWVDTDGSGTDLAVHGEF